MDNMDNICDIDRFNGFFSSPTMHPQVTVAELRHADSSFFTRRTYGMYVLLLMENKVAKVLRDGMEIEYGCGSLITLRPGQVLEIQRTDETPEEEVLRGWSLAFKPELLEKTGLGRDFYMFSYFNTDFPEATGLTKMEHRVINNCFTNLYAELHTPQDYLSGQMIRLGIGTLLSYVKRYFERQHTSGTGRGETWSVRLDNLLNRYLSSGQPAQHGQPNVAWCASQFGLSPNYFGDLVKKELHITAQEYIRNKIITHAQVLLRQTNMTINEIAEELGFAYPNHFTRMFRKSTGYTPLKFRKG